MSTSESKAAAARRKAAEAVTSSEVSEPAATQTLPLDGLLPGAQPEGTAEPSVQNVARPRTRWGAIVWGLIVGSIAVVTLAITRTAADRESFVLWLTQLSPAGIWLIVVLAAGGILLLVGLLAAVRRAQRSRQAARG